MRKDKEARTSAMILFKDVKILTKRPEDMSFEDYKKVRKHQKEMLELSKR